MVDKPKKDEPPVHSGSKKNLLPDLIIPLLALAFTLYYFTTISGVPWIAQASAVTVGLLLITAIVAFAIRCWWQISRGQSELRWRSSATTTTTASGEKRLLGKRLGLLVLTVAYVVVIETLGFTLTTFLFLLSSIVLLSSLSNWRAATLVAVICSGVGYLVFIALFNTRFPFGVIEQLIERWWS